MILIQVPCAAVDFKYFRIIIATKLFYNMRLLNIKKSDVFILFCLNFFSNSWKALYISSILDWCRHLLRIHIYAKPFVFHAPGVFFPRKINIFKQSVKKRRHYTVDFIRSSSIANERRYFNKSKNVPYTLGDIFLKSWEG